MPIRISLRLGRYRRIMPFRFSLLPRRRLEYGSAKYVSMPSPSRRRVWRANPAPVACGALTPAPAGRGGANPTRTPPPPAEEQHRLAGREGEENKSRNRREVYYGKDANARSQRSRRRHIYLFNPEDMDNADIISMAENSPTYLRDKSTLNSIKMKAEQEGQLATEAAQEAEGGAGGVITF